MNPTIERLSQEVTFDQYNAAKELFSAMKDEGISSAKAAALCYRAGYVFAKQEARIRRNKFHTERMERERLAAEIESRQQREKLAAQIDKFVAESEKELEVTNHD